MDRTPHAQPAPLGILPSPPRCPSVMPFGSDWNRFMNESEWDSSMVDAVLRLQTRYTIVSESSDSWSLSGQSPAGEQTDDRTTFDSLEALSTMAQRESAAAMLPLVKAGCVFLIKDRGPVSKMVRPDHMSFLVFFTIPKPHQYWCSLGPSYDHPWLLETGRHMARITELLPGESEEGRDARMRLADHYKALIAEGKINLAALSRDPATYPVYRYSRAALVAYKHPAFATAVAQQSTLAAASSGQAADQGGRGLPGLQSTIAESKSAAVERGQIPQTFANVKTASSSTSVKPTDASVSGSLPGEKAKVVGRGQVSETSADVKTDTGNTSVRPRDATLPGSPPYKKAKVAD
ncbi:MAG: hypothetical protein Q9159_002601 [Coniocarpon cinnabarinum]